MSTATGTGAVRDLVHGGREPAVDQHPRMDAADRAALVVERRLGLLVRLLDQGQGRPRRHLHLGPAQGHREGDQPLLDAVVQVPLDPLPSVSEASTRSTATAAGRRPPPRVRSPTVVQQEARERCLRDPDDPDQVGRPRQATSPMSAASQASRSGGRPASRASRPVHPGEPGCEQQGPRAR